jgi:hypothetical protein
MYRLSVLILAVLLAAPAAFAESGSKEHWCDVVVASGGDVGGKTLILMLKSDAGLNKVKATTDREGKARFSWKDDVNEGQVMVNGTDVGTCTNGGTLRLQAGPEGASTTTNRCAVQVVDSNGKPAATMVEVRFNHDDKPAKATARTNSAGLANMTWRSNNGSDADVFIEGKRLGRCTDGGETTVTLRATEKKQPESKTESKPESKTKTKSKGK